LRFTYKYSPIGQFNTLRKKTILLSSKQGLSGIPDREFPGIGAVSIRGREFLGILKTSDLYLSKNFVQNFDRIWQNLPYLLL